MTPTSTPTLSGADTALKWASDLPPSSFFTFIARCREALYVDAVACELSSC